MSFKLKKAIALLAAFCLIFACVPMNAGTVKVKADDWRATYSPVKTIILPEDWDTFVKNEDWLNYQKDEGNIPDDEAFYYDSITVTDTSALTGGAIKIQNSFCTANLTIKAGAIVDLEEGYWDGAPEYPYWSNRIMIDNGTLNLDGELYIHHADNTVYPVRDDEGNIEYDDNGDVIEEPGINELLFFGNSSVNIGSTGKLIVDGSHLFTDNDSEITFDISGKFEVVKADFGTGYNSLLNIKNGALVIDDYSTFNLESDSTLHIGKTGSLVFGDENEEYDYLYGANERCKIEIEDGGAVKSISPSGTSRFSTTNCISLKLGSKYFSTTAEFGGESHPIVYDGSRGNDWQRFIVDKNGNWTIDGEASWWGEPFEGEYKLYSENEAGVVTINGVEASYREYYKIEKGKTLNFKLTPPAGSTATPIVSIFQDGVDVIFYRTDSLKPSDYDYDNMSIEPFTFIDNLVALEMTNNEFSFTPETDDPLNITIFWAPSDAVISGFVDIYGQYRWRYDLDNAEWKKGAYDSGVQGWADPGSEFVVEASTTGSGEVALTPGFGFYRLGNTVAEGYQGGELAKGGVNATFTPASGYELTSVIVDGTAVSLSSLTKKGGSYVYNLAKLPEKISKDYAFTSKAPDTAALIKKFLPNGIPTLNIQGVFTLIPTSSGGSGSGTGSTVTTTPEPTQAPATTTPEVTVEKSDDGSTTTTKVTENADGSTTTEVKTKGADGSESTSVTVENKDGSSTTNTETKNADGTKTTEKTVEKADGTSTTVSKTVDEKGNVLSTTEQEVSKNSKGTEIVETKIENADGSSVESVVKTTTEGKVVSETVEIDVKGNLEITLETDKPDGSEVVKTFEAAADDGVKLTDYDTKGSTAVVPGEIKVGDTTYTVTTIGKKALAGNTDITKVKLPETITTIGKGAFQGASNLKKIELGSEVTKVSKNAFKGIAKNAVIKIKATKAEFDRIVALIKASGIDKSVTFKRVKP